MIVRKREELKRVPGSIVADYEPHFKPNLCRKSESAPDIRGNLATRLISSWKRRAAETALKENQSPNSISPNIKDQRARFFVSNIKPPQFLFCCFFYRGGEREKEKKSRSLYQLCFAPNSLIHQSHRFNIPALSPPNTSPAYPIYSACDTIALVQFAHKSLLIS
ncbi:hypothetical protein BASA61_006066 [Batrachochytrium salamandrivorans]|nr:hypothetical protein BASA60_002515 [Batrachochytrium salamandrivorans]KAH6588161.1 hypothetical protein BASA61_006066 [Batrachochytrium salamandrivorans]